MPTKILLAVAAVFIAGAAFCAGLLVDRLVISRAFAGRSPAVSPADPKPPTDVRREALLQYLDGKTIVLKDAKDVPDEKGTRHTIKKGEIEAMQFPTSMAKGNDASEPWRPQLGIILNTSEGKYYVVCTVPYQQIEGSYVFLGFEVASVNKQ